jgi:hypothetical protein
LRNGSSFLIDGKLEGKGCEAACGILTKVSSPSSLGEYSYEPTIFVGTQQINGDQKLELIFIGHVLGQVQGKPPVRGRIIDAELKSHGISLESSYKILTSTLQDLQRLIQAKSPAYLLFFAKITYPGIITRESVQSDIWLYKGRFQELSLSLLLPNTCSFLELCRHVDFKTSLCLSFSCRKRKILINLSRKG